jgi:hypothetical protein
MPRYVLLYHECPPTYERTSHWDFMLEDGDVLRTWALPQLPRNWHVAHARTRAIHPDCSQLSKSNEVVAEPLANHRLAYLELEGLLSGNRGEVSRVATGNYSGSQTPDKKWRVSLAGELTGRVTLARPAGEGTWRLEIMPTK